MSREAFEAWWKNEGLKKATAVGVACKGASGLSYEAWQAALAWAYEDAARVCREAVMHNGDHLKNSDLRVTCAEALRERANEVCK